MQCVSWEPMLARAKTPVGVLLNTADMWDFIDWGERKRSSCSNLNTLSRHRSSYRRQNVKYWTQQQVFHAVSLRWAEYQNKEQPGCEVLFMVVFKGSFSGSSAADSAGPDLNAPRGQWLAFQYQRWGAAAAPVAAAARRWDQAAFDHRGTGNLAWPTGQRNGGGGRLRFLKKFNVKAFDGHQWHFVSFRVR